AAQRRADGDGSRVADGGGPDAGVSEYAGRSQRVAGKLAAGVGELGGSLDVGEPCRPGAEEGVGVGVSGGGGGAERRRRRAAPGEGRGGGERGGDAEPAGAAPGGAAAARGGAGSVYWVDRQAEGVGV